MLSFREKTGQLQKETGQLCLEKVIVFFDIPILFVCNDFENRKYLCVNVDEEKGTTVIAETEIGTLMLCFKIRRQWILFLEALNDRVIIAEYDEENEEIVTQIESAKEISEDFLPEKGALLEQTKKEILEYSSYLKKQIINVEFEHLFDKKTIFIEPGNYQVQLLFKSEKCIKSENVTVIDTKKKCFYQIDSNKKMIA
ncbi:MAG: hypothetical protein PUF19_07725 [Fusicatenibacter saccharivorans]|nr:hypothetical protein [Fusicatenibacter saccharivorans]